MLRLLVLAPLALLAACAVPAPAAQPASGASGFTADERAQGYALRGDSTVFVFDPAAYGYAAGVAPERVVVTGTFRAWSADMERRIVDADAGGLDGVWTLAVANDGYTAASRRRVRSSFASTTRRAPAAGSTPRRGAPNVDAGNLVFLLRRDAAAPRRRASERDEPLGARSPAPSARSRPDHFRVVRWDSVEVPVASVERRTKRRRRVAHARRSATTWTRCTTSRSASPELLKPRVRAMARFDGLWRDVMSTKPLGATVNHGRLPPGCARGGPGAPRGDHLPPLRAACRLGARLPLPRPHRSGV